MNSSDFGSCVVVTSIRKPTEQVLAFCREPGWRTVFVADQKTPVFRPPLNLEVLTVDWQLTKGGTFAGKLPWRHYARKNIGYIHAIRRGVRVIFDTDDDNRPISPWTPRPTTNVGVAADPTKWVNVYAYFGARHVWPRGYPLEEIGACCIPATQPTSTGDVMVWQGLVEGDPDVDAIFRLTRCDPIRFESRCPIVLRAGSYCPFNSQNTWWSEPSFPYLYLPSTVSFRFTDILRGYVAQRCFWAHGWRLGFQEVTARQERNAHNLLADFRDEIGMYSETARIIARLDALHLGVNPAANLRACYTALAEGGWVKPEELGLVECWLEAVEAPSVAAA